VKDHKIQITAVLRCAWCGVGLEEKWEGSDVINPGGRLVVMLHLCDTCWGKYKEAKNERRVH